MAHPPGKAGATTGQVLMFTGVRREVIKATPDLYAPAQHEPMFEDPAPGKPRGKKPRRGKRA
ncbi:hypothetical protein OEG84_00915 [Hoeflea sp. G2-23]|uniref:Uncharacterized protein n=1 Tax=Hoeflea algicola TaxID=2983763 RepID=A0ABT3Z3H1_9HYPH|nr:hypothetical protein [Hoeflea algicola]MCY0146315.1 hypothetical protein [Hoeflea algicola]